MRRVLGWLFDAFWFAFVGTLFVLIVVSTLWK